MAFYICRYAAELHLVHKKDSGSVAVVSILYELGDADPFINKVEFTSHFHCILIFSYFQRTCSCNPNKQYIFLWLTETILFISGKISLFSRQSPKILILSCMNRLEASHLQEKILTNESYSWLQIKDKLDALAKEVCAGNEEARIPVGVLDNKLLRKNTRKYYRYVGSFTSPPCTENVIWNILGKVIFIHV